MSTPHIARPHRDPTLASLWSRVLALVATPFVIFGIAFCFFAFGSILQAYLGDAFSSRFFALYILTLLSLVWFNYYLIIVYGQSLGKMLVGIRVVDAKTRMPTGYIKVVLIRDILTQLVSRLTMMIFTLVDYLHAINDDLSQCWHDRWAQTVVVKATKANGTHATAKRKIMGALLALLTCILPFIFILLIFMSML